MHTDTKEKELEAEILGPAPPKPKGKRGRKPGSKNKSKPDPMPPEMVEAVLSLPFNMSSSVFRLDPPITFDQCAGGPESKMAIVQSGVQVTKDFPILKWFKYINLAVFASLYTVSLLTCGMAILGRTAKKGDYEEKDKKPPATTGN